MRRATLLVLTLSIATTAFAADVLVSLGFPTAARPGERAFIGGLVKNRVPQRPATVHLVMTFDPSLVIEQDDFYRIPPECTLTPGRIECTKADLSSGDLSVLVIVRVPEAPLLREYVFRAGITSTPEDTTPLDNTDTTTLHVIGQHVVSNTNDSGPGSLRAAIEAANDWCTRERPCEIHFRFPEGPVPVIEPLSPLPALTACNVTVGKVPLFGTKRALVEVEIDGRRLASGRGLELHAACTYPLPRLFGIAIRNFPGDGVAITSETAFILNGLDIRSNGGRGIGVYAQSPSVEVSHSLIGGNRHSGIAMFGGHLRLEKSRIGIGWNGEELHNGASGIFFAPTGGALEVSQSIIANHPHFGVAIARRRSIDVDAETMITHNTLDFDWHLDGPSTNEHDADIPDTPRILSARYDPATDTTRVTVSLQEPPVDLTIVRLYVSDRVTIFGTAHLERLVRAVTAAGETVSVDLPGDLRGKYMSAVTTWWFHGTFPDSPPPDMRWMSEASAAVKVE